MIDSHCHLDFEQFEGRLEAVLDEARHVGVSTIVNIGVDLPSSRRSVELAEKHDMIYATIGVHPHDAKTLDSRVVDELTRLAAHDRVVAVGEIGLDFYRDLSPRDVQRRAFRRQLELAVTLEMPVVIHTREAFEETLKIVREYASRLPGGVFHCFPGSIDDAMRVFDLGFVVSVGGVITYKNSRMARVAAAVPLEKLMLETDAPYLTPVPFRGQVNQPAYVRYTLRKLAELRGISGSETEAVTDRTTRKLYRLVDTFGG